MAGKATKTGDETKEKEDKKDARTRSGSKYIADSKQTTLDNRMKKLAFTEKEKDFKEKIEEEVRKIRQEALAMEKMKIEMKEREVELIERVEKVEKRLKELEDREIEREARWREEVESRLDVTAGDGASSLTLTRGSLRSLVSGGSAESGHTGISGVSRWSRASFSEREVSQMKRLLSERERKDNVNVIAIKGLAFDENKETVNATVLKFLRDKLNVEVLIGSDNIRTKGKVIVIKLNSAEDKETIMQNKNKLAGTKILIEHFRSYEDRKRQEEIAAWVKEKREKGLVFKIGFGKIFYKNVWYKWEEKGKLLERLVVEERKDKEEENLRLAAENRETNKRVDFSEGLHFH